MKKKRENERKKDKVKRNDERNRRKSFCGVLYFYLQLRSNIFVVSRLPLAI
jgi:hypothetical protein